MIVYVYVDYIDYIYIYMILYRFIDVGLWELLSTFAVGCHVHVRLP